MARFVRPFEGASRWVKRKEIGVVPPETLCVLTLSVFWETSAELKENRWKPTYTALHAGFTDFATEKFRVISIKSRCD